MNTDKPTLKIQFDTQEQLEQFATWLCNKGEDHYAECGDASGDYEPVRFIFHQDSKFIADNTILTENYEH